MVEATPGFPYGGDTGDLARVEVNMAMRRYRIKSVCPSGVVPFSIVSYPLLGAVFPSLAPLARSPSGGGPERPIPFLFTDPPLPPGGPFARSSYIPDACISPHPRFGTLTANIRHRRGKKVAINVPLFIDEQTLSSTPTASPLIAGKTTTLAGEGREVHFASAPAWPGGAAAKSALEASPFGGGAEDDGGMGLAAAEAIVAAADAAAATKADISGDASPSSALPTMPEAISFAARAELKARREGLWERDHDVGRNEDSVDETAGRSTVARHSDDNLNLRINMDAMAFGMGCCCLQVTFQARDLSESRALYDGLQVISPLMLALTANAPIWRGQLADTDTRWEVISASVDCRTPAEKGLLPVPTTTASSSAAAPPSWTSHPDASGAAGSGGQRRIYKSRYSSIDCFISESPRLKEGYNDLPLPVDEEALTMLTAGGVDERLAKHIAGLFVRDPLVIFSERVDQVDDRLTTEHFENFQSTNWRSVRWKPPPPDAKDMGWRVELRTMEAQTTDFENAAFTVFVVLLSRVLLSFDLNLYLPLSLVEENFARASQREAASKQKFWFRREKDVLPESLLMAAGCSAAASASAVAAAATAASASVPSTASAPGQEPSTAAAPEAARGGVYGEAEEMTLAQIFLGYSYDSSSGSCSSSSSSGAAPSAGGGSEKRCQFPGFIPLIFAYLELINCDESTKETIDQYLRFVAGRATGAIMTGATWQRRFVASHPQYRKDSAVTPDIVFDLLKKMNDIADGKVGAPELLGAMAPLPITITEEALSPTASPAKASATSTTSTTSSSSSSFAAKEAQARARLRAALRSYAEQGGTISASSASASSLVDDADGLFKSQQQAGATPRLPANEQLAAAAAGSGGGVGSGGLSSPSSSSSSSSSNGIKLRGRSFAEEIKAPSHPMIARLLRKFTVDSAASASSSSTAAGSASAGGGGVEQSFDDVPAFLS